VTDGITKSLDGERLESSLEHLPFRHGPGVATHLCQAIMARALAGRGPREATEWDDDRTVVVATIGAPPDAGLVASA
jgi:hypothetical protein